METSLQLLVKADQNLGKISVKSDDVFLMADARRLLKAAFDSIRKEVTQNESSESVSGVGSAGDTV